MGFVREGKDHFFFRELCSNVGISRAFTGAYMCKWRHHTVYFRIPDLSLQGASPALFSEVIFPHSGAAGEPLQCNTKLINRIAVRSSRETVLTSPLRTESRMEATQIKCNGIKYIAPCTVTRSWELTSLFSLLPAFPHPSL